MNFIAGQLPISVENVEELINTRTKDGGIVQTAGYKTAGDGGNNQYFYRLTGRSTLPSIRGGLQIAGTGADDYYDACDKTLLNPRKYGAVDGRLGDATDIFSNISADCVDFDKIEQNVAQTVKIYLPDGDYRFRYWSLPAPAQIYGEGFACTYLIAAPNAGTCDFTCSASTGQFTTKNFPWSVGRRVTFSGALPSEIQAGRTYFVVSTTFSEYNFASTVSFSVSEVPGGVALSLSTDGSGLAIHGSFITDRGNGAKLTPQGMTIWSNIKSIADGSQLTSADPDYESPHVSAVWDVGPTPNKGNVGIPWGSGSWMRDVSVFFWTHAVGFEINLNIAHMNRCWAEQCGMGFRMRGNGWGAVHAQCTGNRGVSFQYTRSKTFEVDYASSTTLIWCDEPVPTINTPVYFIGDDLPAGIQEQVPYYVGSSDLLVSFTADASTDKIQSASHGLSNGFRVYFTGADLPGGLSRQTKYYVINKTTNDFEVSLTKGGSAVDITSAGSGTMRYFRMSFYIVAEDGGAPVDLVDNGSGEMRYSIYSTAALDIQGGTEVDDFEIEAPFSYEPLVVDGSEQLRCNLSGVYWSLNNAGSLFTAVASTDVFTKGANITGYNGATLSDGLEVYLNGDELPEPIIANRRYWVRDLSGSTFKLAATSGGDAIDVTTDGSGTISITPKPNNLVRWTRPYGNLTNPRVSPGATGYYNYGVFRSSNGGMKSIAQPDGVSLSTVRHNGPLVADSLVLPYQSGYAVLTAESDGVVRAARVQLSNWLADFNGTDTKVVLGRTIQLTKPGEYTYSFRCSVRTVGTVLAGHTTSNDSYLGYFFGATDMRHQSYNNSGVNYVTATLPVACDNGDLHHYVIRRMPGNVYTIWQDGVACVTALVGTVLENFGWINVIGRRGIDPGLWFDGQLDFFRAWDRGLTDDEVTAEFAGTSPTGLLLAYEFTDAAGTSVKDFGSGNNEGTLSSADIPAVWVNDADLDLLTAIDSSTVNSGDATTDGVLNNVRTRLNELEAILQAAGLVGS